MDGEIEESPVGTGVVEESTPSKAREAEEEVELLLTATPTPIPTPTITQDRVTPTITSNFLLTTMPWTPARAAPVEGLVRSASDISSPIRLRLIVRKHSRSAQQ